MARATRSLIYGEEITPSGPLPKAATAEGDAVRVSFEDVTGEVLSYGSGRPVGFELCGPRSQGAATCRWAEGHIEGEEVVLEADGGAARVRYCWADSPVCTLYDEDGMPAIPFEIPIERSPDS